MKKKLLIAAGFALFLLALAPSIYFYAKWRQSERTSADPTQAAKDRASQVLAKISKFMELPDEEPTLATVSDVTKLVNQPFFAKAKNGDQVIIFQGARLAILYDPLANKIINVAPVNIGSPSAQVAQKLRFALYNGTNIVGLTKQYEKTLVAAVSQAEVVAKENAKNRDYEKSIIVAISGKPEAQDIANKLSLSLTPLPAGETKPEGADFLIILGTDRK